MAFRLVKQRGADPWNESDIIVAPHHRVRFARARLSVRKHAGIVAFECRCDHIFSEVCIDLPLRCIAFSSIVLRIIRKVVPINEEEDYNWSV